MSFPSTITNPEAFMRSPAAGFDGVFDWSWTNGCFCETRISPMDFDGVVERNGQFLIFETKSPGTKVPKGQRYTLERAHGLRCFTIMLIHGKTAPVRAVGFFPLCANVKKKYRKMYGVDECRCFVMGWYRWADGRGRIAA